jgi:hypothetical protein
MSCGITSGLSIDCAQLRRVGGVNKRAYAYNVEGVTYTINGNGYLTAFDFPAYQGLYEITSRKQSHSGGSTLVKQEPGGNTFYNHDVILKVFPDSPDDDTVLEDLAVGEFGIILETNNQEFFLYGAYNGMENTAAAQNSGQAPASDIGSTLTFTGSETGLPIRISLGTYAATKAYLESMTI